MSTKKAIGGLILGAATGVALGLLFAPKRGKDTRKALVDTGSEYFEKFGEDFKSSFEEQLDRVLSKNTERAEERARKQIEEVKKEIARLKEN
ncbi:MAG TPA: YtxH domain-containing protein [Flavobacteriaceae bacterium]|nr:YtxH domain-containing protein [Flavobacteriaceae bacterium]